MVLAVIQLVNYCMVLSATDFISALAEMITNLVMSLAEMITNLVMSLAEWVVGLLTGGSPISLLVVITLIVLILGKLRGNDRY